MERQCSPTLPPIARLSLGMQRSSPIVSSGMEPLVQSCGGDNERVNQSEVRKGKVFMEECSLLLAQGLAGGRRVQVYLCMRRGLKEMTANPLERRVGGAGEGDKRRSAMTRLTLAPRCSPSPEAGNLHHSSFVKLIFQILSRLRQRLV